MIWNFSSSWFQVLEKNLWVGLTLIYSVSLNTLWGCASSLRKFFVPLNLVEWIFMWFKDFWLIGLGFLNKDEKGWMRIFGNEKCLFQVKICVTTFGQFSVFGNFKSFNLAVFLSILLFHSFMILFSRIHFKFTCESLTFEICSPHTNYMLAQNNLTGRHRFF